MKINDLTVFVNYSINSFLGDVNEDRYCQEIGGSACVEENTESEEMIKIGKIRAYKLLISECCGLEDVSMEDLFDSNDTVLEITNKIMDCNNKWFELKDKVLEFYEDGIYNSNILIIDSVEVIEKYSGNKIGQRLIKDLINNFGSGCGIVVLKVFPLQQAMRIVNNDNKDVWHKEMSLNTRFGKSVKCKEKLKKYYQTIGFDSIPRFSSSLMFYNPAMKNERFESIKFDL